MLEWNNVLAMQLVAEKAEWQQEKLVEMALGSAYKGREAEQQRCLESELVATEHFPLSDMVWV